MSSIFGDCRHFHECLAAMRAYRRILHSAGHSTTLAPAPAEKHPRTICLREAIKAVKSSVPCVSACECRGAAHRVSARRDFAALGFGLHHPDVFGFGLRLLSHDRAVLCRHQEIRALGKTAEFMLLSATIKEDPGVSFSAIFRRISVGISIRSSTRTASSPSRLIPIHRLLLSPAANKAVNRCVPSGCSGF